MKRDPIVEEIHQTRQKLLKECGGDLNLLMDRLKAAEIQDRSRVVSTISVRSVKELNMAHTQNWIPLTEIKHVDRRSPRPRGMKFPDGQIMSFSTSQRYGGGWINVLKTTAAWLVDTKRLTPKTARVRHREYRHLYVTAGIEQQHPGGGKRFKNGEQINTSGVYVEKNWKALDNVSGAMGLLERFSIDPSTVLVNY